MNEWVTNFSNLLSVLSACGLLGGGMWLYRRENKRIKKAEAAKAEADLNSLASKEWKEIAENREQKLDAALSRNKELSEQVTGLFDVIGQWRDRCDEKDTRIHELELKIMSDSIRLCNKRGCAEREPQTGF